MCLRCSLYYAKWVCVTNNVIAPALHYWPYLLSASVTFLHIYKTVIYRIMPMLSWLVNGHLVPQNKGKLHIFHTQSKK